MTSAIPSLHAARSCLASIRPLAWRRSGYVVPCILTKPLLRKHCSTASARKQATPSDPRRSFIRKASRPSRIARAPHGTLLQSSTRGWLVLLLAIGGTSVLLEQILSSQTNYTSSTNNKPLESSPPDVDSVESTMTGEVLEGRPGNLTPEQELKLKEFWVAALKVFGVITGPPVAAEGEQVTLDEHEAGKTPKKRLGLFRKKKDEPAHEAGEAKSRTSISADADDKYGQTKEFHDALASQTPATLRNAFWTMVKHDHPDALLLRFLRARKWDVEKALVMMVSTLNWRVSQMHIDDDIMARGELGMLEDSQSSDPEKKALGEGFLLQMRSGKSMLHGYDNAGRPCCIATARLHRSSEQTELSLERYTVYILETARLLLEPPVDTACIVFDLTGFSMANMDYAPVKFMIKCFEANYPESLGVVLVHKAPWIFQGIWRVIRGWLDPVVAAKVNFTNNMDEIKGYIPLSQVSKALGGDQDWEYKYSDPVPGENDLMKDTAKRDELLTAREGLFKEYEQLTTRWVDEPADDSSAIKVQRHELAQRLKADYWRLDPYIRARSFYDRVGVLPHSSGSTTARSVADAPASETVHDGDID